MMRRRFSQPGAWALLLIISALLGSPISAAGQDIELPIIPHPVPVTVDPTTTALIFSDFTPQNCPNSPACLTAMTPMSALLARARQRGMLVIHTTSVGQAAAGFMSEVAPLPSEPVFIRPTAGMQGSWWGEGLEETLRAREIETVILAGSQAAGIILHGSFQSSFIDGYTVVAPVDGMPSPTEFRLLYTQHHVLNFPGGRQNPNNNPLEPGAVTLSRSDLISF